MDSSQLDCAPWQWNCTFCVRVKPDEGVAPMKTIAILVLTGALIGVVMASFIVPPALAWYTSPGGLPQGAQIQAVVQIPEVIRYATSRLLTGQLIGAAIGAAIGLALGIFAHVRSREPKLTVPGSTTRRATPA